MSAGNRLCECQNYPPEIMQPSSSTRATIVSAENQNGATIVKAIFFFCHYYIAWEPNNAGEARGQSWDRSLKSRWIPGGSCGYTSGTKRKHFAALSSPWPCWRWLQLQPSCGSPQWWSRNKTIKHDLTLVITVPAIGVGARPSAGIGMAFNFKMPLVISQLKMLLLIKCLYFK